METPDKIWVTTSEMTSLLSKKRHDYDVCYIRRDALLEWAKKEMGKWSSESNTAQGVKMGLTLVMDKIESL